MPPSRRKGAQENDPSQPTIRNFLIPAMMMLQSASAALTTVRYLIARVLVSLDVFVSLDFSVAFI